MRIAVYAIAKDEERHAARFIESTAKADDVVVADTGSSDHTKDILREGDVSVYEVSVSPWRFDIARNAALALVPADADVCISLDIDEVLSEGWREVIEELWTPELNRIRYPVHLIHGGQYMGDKIHRRHGHHWVYPCHECLNALDGEQHLATDRLQVYNRPLVEPDHADRHQLMRQAVEENPSDPRPAFYYGLELMISGHCDEAKAEFKRVLDLSRVRPERAVSCRHISKCLDREIDKSCWLYQAVAEDPSQRECWVELAMCLYNLGDYEGAWHASGRALSITQPPGTYVTDARAWGDVPGKIRRAALDQIESGMCLSAQVQPTGISY